MAGTMSPAPRREPSSSQDIRTHSTIEVVRRARRGDWRALQALVERALPNLRRWAHGRVPTYARQDANTEDVVQDVALGALKNLRSIRRRSLGELQAYLRRSVINRIRDLIRTTSRRGVAVEFDDQIGDDAPTPLERAILRERTDGFVKALSRLSPRDRMVLIWRLELGYSAEEIAAKLGKSKAAAGMAVTRAVSRLAKELRIDR